MDSGRSGEINLQAIVEQVLEVLRARGFFPPGGDSASWSGAEGTRSPRQPALGLCTAGPPARQSSAEVPAISSGPDNSPSTATNEKVSPQSSSSDSAPASRSSQSEAPDGALILRKRVITLSDLSDYLPKLRRLIVPPRAILSPAVVDELAQRSVKVEYTSDSREAEFTSTTSAEKVQIAIEVVSRRLQPAELLAQLSREGITARAEQGECLVAATKRLGQAIPGDCSLGAILTRHPALAICLANRHPSLRATWAGSVPEMLDHVQDVGANVLVLDIGKLSLWQLVQILARFVRLGPQPPPIEELSGNF